MDHLRLLLITYVTEKLFILFYLAVFNFCSSLRMNFVLFILFNIFSFHFFQV